MAESMKQRYKRLYEEKLNLPGAAISDRLAAILFAKDLMVGDPEKFKAGYTAPNAAIAAAEVFGVRADEVEEAL